MWSDQPTPDTLVTFLYRLRYAEKGLCFISPEYLFLSSCCQFPGPGSSCASLIILVCKCFDGCRDEVLKDGGNKSFLRGKKWAVWLQPYSTGSKPLSLIINLGFYIVPVWDRFVQSYMIQSSESGEAHSFWYHVTFLGLCITFLTTAWVRVTSLRKHTLGM